MKNVKNLFTVILMLGTLAAARAQTRVVRVYPKHGTVVTTLRSPKLIVHNNVRYHLAEGVWYRARGKRFVVCAAPRGIRVRTLPRGYAGVTVNGRKLYKYKGVWYKKSGRKYIVITV